jgi:hypothetical protein
VSKEQLIKGLITAPKNDDKNAEDFNEWLNFLVKPLQDKQKWDTLTDKLKYYNYKNYKLHLEPTAENKRKITLNFGKMYKIPDNLDLLPEVVEYINSNPKPPARWQLGNYLDIQEKTDKNKIMSRRRSTQASRINQKISDASLTEMYKRENNDTTSTHKMWARGKKSVYKPPKQIIDDIPEPVRETKNIKYLYEPSKYPGVKFSLLDTKITIFRTGSILFSKKHEQYVIEDILSVLKDMFLEQNFIKSKQTIQNEDTTITIWDLI